jgi:hypothetical protein
VSAPSANTLFRAAQDFVREGQPVFPCKTQGDRAKAPYTRNGLKDATCDLTQIKQWWRTRGDAALGIPTGIVWDVLDVDIKDTADGRVHLPMLQRLGLLNGCQKVVRTPSGGWHLYFHTTKGLTNKARGATLGLDVRGLGGYVLAPPSYIETPEYSGFYEDVGPTTGATSDPLHWDLVVSSIMPIDTDSNKPVMVLPSERRASLAALREWVSALESGERNNGLHWAVCRCIDNGLDPHELVEPAILSGLGEPEILLTISSALKRAGVTADDLETEGEALFPEA